MTSCLLCLNYLEENEALQIDQCFAGSFSGLEMINSHFDFSERIFENSGDLKSICSNCWSQLVNFHEFHLAVATNYGLIEEIQPEVKDEEIQRDEDEIMDENNIVAWEEYVEGDDFETERVEALDECLFDTTIIAEDKKPETKELKPHIIDLPVPRTQRRMPPPPIDPADDVKIREIANMNCDICHKLLDSLAQARAHFRHEHGTIGYLMCCGRKFKQRNRLLDHVNTHFNLTYPCVHCGKTFDSKAYLVRHLVYHDDVKLYECAHCPKTFAKKFLVRNHLLSVHIFEKVAPTFECHIEGCDKVFVNEARLKHHLKYTHVSPDSEICAICQKTFKTKAAIEEHMRIHTRRIEDRYQCNICGHYISELKTFKRHVRNHETESRDNTCHVCGKKSPNLNALKKHIRYVHETERLYQCRYCDKSFKRPRNCMDHEASVHTMQDLYECPFCIRTFRNQSNMLAHRKKNHPEQYKQPTYLLDADAIIAETVIQE